MQIEDMNEVSWRHIRNGLLALSLAIVIAAVTLAVVLNQIRTTYAHEQHLKSLLRPHHGWLHRRAAVMSGTLGT